MAIKCVNCGQVLLRDNARFCNSCGAPLHFPPQDKQQGDSSFSEEDTIFPDESAVFSGDSVEDLPTALLKATIPEPPVQKPLGTAAGGAINWAPTIQDSHLDDVAKLSTSRLASQKQVKPEELLRQQRQAPMQVGGGSAFQKPPLTPQLRPHPTFQAVSPVQKGKQVGSIPLTPVVAAPKVVKRQGINLKRLVIVLVLLFILVAGGIAAWIIVFQPFAVSSITQPWQQFCDPGLAVSGQYPTGWMKQSDPNKALRFSDGTDQFNIASAPANGQDAAKYLQKEASQLGITGLKIGTPVSFAGTSWQQAQGSLLQSQTGVTYTETLLVTVHGNRFFTIMQVAPPGTYSEEDKTIFSGMRSSFQFSNRCS